MLALGLENEARKLRALLLEIEDILLKDFENWDSNAPDGPELEKDVLGVKLIPPVLVLSPDIRRCSRVRPLLLPDLWELML